MPEEPDAWVVAALREIGLEPDFSSENNVEKLEADFARVSKRLLLGNHPDKVGEANHEQYLAVRDKIEKLKEFFKNFKEKLKKARLMGPLKQKRDALRRTEDLKKKQEDDRKKREQEEQNRAQERDENLRRERESMRYMKIGACMSTIVRLVQDHRLCQAAAFQEWLFEVDQIVHAGENWGRMCRRLLHKDRRSLVQDMVRLAKKNWQDERDGLRAQVQEQKEENQTLRQIVSEVGSLLPAKEKDDSIMSWLFRSTSLKSPSKDLVAKVRTEVKAMANCSSNRVRDLEALQKEHQILQSKFQEQMECTNRLQKTALRLQSKCTNLEKDAEGRDRSESELKESVGVLEQNNQRFDMQVGANAEQLEATVAQLSETLHQLHFQLEIKSGEHKAESGSCNLIQAQECDRERLQQSLFSAIDWESFHAAIYQPECETTRPNTSQTQLLEKSSALRPFAQLTSPPDMDPVPVRTSELQTDEVSSKRPSDPEEASLSALSEGSRSGKDGEGGL